VAQGGRGEAQDGRGEDASAAKNGPR